MLSVHKMLLVCNEISTEMESKHIETLITILQGLLKTIKAEASILHLFFFISSKTFLLQNIHNIKCTILIISKYTMQWH